MPTLQSAGSHCAILYKIRKLFAGKPEELGGQAQSSGEKTMISADFCETSNLKPQLMFISVLFGGLRIAALADT